MVEGNEVDLHNAHWHGNVLLRDGHRVDQCAPPQTLEASSSACSSAVQRCVSPTLKKCSGVWGKCCPAQEDIMDFLYDAARAGCRLAWMRPTSQVKALIESMFIVRCIVGHGRQERREICCGSLVCHNASCTMYFAENVLTLHACMTVQRLAGQLHACMHHCMMSLLWPTKYGMCCLF